MRLSQYIAHLNKLQEELGGDPTVVINIYSDYSCADTDCTPHIVEMERVKGNPDWLRRTSYFAERRPDVDEACVIKCIQLCEGN